MEYSTWNTWWSKAKVWVRACMIVVMEGCSLTVWESKSDTRVWIHNSVWGVRSLATKGADWNSLTNVGKMAQNEGHAECANVGVGVEWSATRRSVCYTVCARAFTFAWSDFFWWWSKFYFLFVLPEGLWSVWFHTASGEVLGVEFSKKQKWK